MEFEKVHPEQGGTAGCALKKIRRRPMERSVPVCLLDEKREG